MKKYYQKPCMKVIELKHQPCLLAGSGEGGDDGEDFEFGYMPGIGSDNLGKLA